MSTSHILRKIFIFGPIVVLAGCGLYVPDKSPLLSSTPNEESTSKSSPQANYENKIIEHINCELKKGLVSAKHWNLPWLTSENFGTSVTLTITAEQQSGVNIGASLTAPFRNGLKVYPAAEGGNVVIPQSFSLGIGATGAANATRTETIQYTLRNSDLVASALYTGDDCSSLQSGVMIDGNLKIPDFIYDNTELAFLNNLNSAIKTPVFVEKKYRSIRDVPVFNTFTDEINFVAAFGGSVNPTWKLVEVTANTPGNLFGVENTYTNDLVVTIGLLASDKVPFQLDSAAQAQHQSRVNANAIATSIQSQAH